MTQVCSRWSAGARVVLAVAVCAMLPVLSGQDKPAGQNEKPPAASQPAMADATGSYKADPVHSSNAFRIKHANIAEFYGRFNDISGEYTLDSAKPEACKFEFEIKTASVDTRVEARDKHLRSAEFFDAEKYPNITFKSSKVRKAGDNVYEVAGDLTLHGVTKPLTVRIELTGAGPAMRGEFRSGLETKFTIDRRDYGMKGFPGMLGDEVLIAVAIEGVRS